MACPRCGNDCTCACSGDPLPQVDWRREISKQVSAHRARRKRKIDPNAPLLDFDEETSGAGDEYSQPAPRVLASAWWTQTVVEPARAPARDPFPDDVVDDAPPIEERVAPQSEVVEQHQEPYVPPELRPPLPPFPRVSRDMVKKKIIEFPRLMARAQGIPEPPPDQLRIFEAVDELPPVSHFADIEIAPEQPAHRIEQEQLELPLQPAPLAARTNAAMLDGIVILIASALFGITAKLFVGSIGFSKPVLAATAACGLLLFTMYYQLSLSYSHTTVGMQANNLWLSTFCGNTPTRAVLRWRALAIALSCAALGMGFAWSLIDEDRLCWHDRITHTYLRQG